MATKQVVARKKEGARQSRALSRKSLRLDALEDGDSDWLSDPLVTKLVKTQVEDLELVNLRRNQFVKQATTLFSRKGYHSTSIKEVAEATKVSPGLIYQYVSDKEQVLFLALQMIVHTNKKVLPERIAAHSRPVHRFIAGFEAYCAVIDANREACMLTYRETKSLSRVHRDAIKNMELSTNEILAACVKECIAAGNFRNVKVELFIYNAIMIAHAWALKHWRLAEIVTFKEYLAHNRDLLLSGLLTESGWSEYRDYLSATGQKPSTKLASRQPTRSANGRR